MNRRTHHFIVSVSVNAEAGALRTKRYIKEALKAWSFQITPHSPLFGLCYADIEVRPLQLHPNPNEKEKDQG